jgi:hypothetical protein
VPCAFTCTRLLSHQTLEPPALLQYSSTEQLSMHGELVRRTDAGSRQVVELGLAGNPLFVALASTGSHAGPVEVQLPIATTTAAAAAAVAVAAPPALEPRAASSAWTLLTSSSHRLAFFASVVAGLVAFLYVCISSYQQTVASSVAALSFDDVSRPTDSAGGTWNVLNVVASLSAGSKVNGTAVVAANPYLPLTCNASHCDFSAFSDHEGASSFEPTVYTLQPIASNNYVRLELAFTSVTPLASGGSASANYHVRYVA